MESPLATGFLNQPRMNGVRCRKLGALVFAVMVLIALVPTAAQAWRRPTSSERNAIASVARGTGHAGPGRVEVKDIHVSTIGPWASAVVELVYTGQPPDDAEDVLHEIGGTWHLTKHSPGTFGEWCGIGMPVRDQRNLGFSRCLAEMSNRVAASPVTAREHPEPTAVPAASTTLQECGRQLVGVAEERAISHVEACSVAERAGKAGVWACVPGAHYPIPGLKRHRFEQYKVSITHPALVIWFRSSRQAFAFQPQCS
jgi:hypothetical protein